MSSMSGGSSPPSKPAKLRQPRKKTHSFRGKKMPVVEVTNMEENSMGTSCKKYGSCDMSASTNGSKISVTNGILPSTNKMVQKGLPKGNWTMHQ